MAAAKLGLDDLLALRGLEGLDALELSVRPFNVVVAVDEFLSENWQDWPASTQERELGRAAALAQRLMSKQHLAKWCSKTAKKLGLKVAEVKEQLSSEPEVDEKGIDPRLFVAEWLQRRRAVYSYGGDSVSLGGERMPAEVIHAELVLDGLRFASLRKDTVFPAYTVWRHAQEKAVLDQFRSKLQFRPVGDLQIRRFVRAVTGAEDAVDLAVVAHFVWQVKRKLLGLPVTRHLMLILFNRKQGGGKTRAVQALLKPIAELLNEANSLEMLEDERQLFRLVRFYVSFFDEMERANRVDMSALKKAITAERFRWRLLGLNQSESGPNNSTFIGATNKDTREMLNDPTGMRRFYQMGTLDKLDWPEINSIAFEELWASIDPQGPCPVEAVLPELEKRQDVLRAQDVLEEWMEARTTLGKDYTKASNAYTDFLDFWKERQKRGEPPSQKRFSMNLKPIIKDKLGEQGHRDDGRGSFFQFTLTRIDILAAGWMDAVPPSRERTGV